MFFSPMYEGIVSEQGSFNMQEGIVSFSNAGGNCVPARAFSNVGVIVLFPKLGLICLISKCGRELCCFRNVGGNCVRAGEFPNVGGCSVRATQSGDGGEVATQVTSLTDSNRKSTRKIFHFLQ